MPYALLLLVLLVQATTREARGGALPETELGAPAGARDLPPCGTFGIKGAAGSGARGRTTVAPEPPPPVGDVPAPELAVLRPSVAGGLGVEDATRAMRRVRAALETCFASRPGTAPPVGRVVVRVLVGPTGGVTDVKVVESTIDRATVGSCVVAALRGLAFPAPRTAAPTSVVYTLAFEPARHTYDRR